MIEVSGHELARVYDCARPGCEGDAREAHGLCPACERERVRRIADRPPTASNGDGARRGVRSYSDEEAEQVRAMKRAHADWGRKSIAKATGIPDARVHAILRSKAVGATNGKPREAPLEPEPTPEPPERDDVERSESGAFETGVGELLAAARDLDDALEEYRQAEARLQPKLEAWFAALGRLPTAPGVATAEA